MNYKKSRRILLAGLLSGSVIAVLGACLDWNWVIALGLVGMFGAILQMVFFDRCPSCGGLLYHVPIPGYCPHCGEKLE